MQHSVHQSLKVQPNPALNGNPKPSRLASSKIPTAVQQSEGVLSQFVEYVPAAVAMVDRQMCYLAWSRRWYSEYGSGDRTCAIGRSHYELFPHLGESWQKRYQHCIETGEPFCHEDCLIKPNGQLEWVKWDIQPWIANDGEIGGLMLSAELLTERKQLADALQLTQFAMDKAADAVLWMTPDAHFSYVNEAACQLLGYTREELSALTVSQIDPAFSPPIWAEHWRAIKQFRTFTFESNYFTQQNHSIPVEVRVNYLTFNGQEYHCAFVRNISERKQAESDLHNANEQLQAVLNAVPGLVSWVSSDLRYLGVNRHLAAAFQMPVDSFADRPVGFLQTSPKFSEMVQDFFASPELTQSTEITLDSKGETRSYLVVSQKYHKGTKAVFIGIDISDRKQMEVALRRSETLYRTLAKNFPNGTVCLFDRDLRHTLAEGTELPKVGLSKELIQGKTLAEAFPSDIARLYETLYRDALAGKESVTEVPFGSRLYLAHTLPLKNEQGETIAGMIMTQNITERKQTEDALRRSEERFRQKAQELKQTLQELKQTQTQLIQTEKMSSLGQLVAGVAHEINNPVSFIYGNIAHARQYVRDLLDLVELYGKEYPEPTPTIQQHSEGIGLNFLIEDFPKLMSSMQVGADRIREVVLSLRNFSRLDQAQKKSVNIHEGIDSTLLILQNRLKAKARMPSIEVIKEYGELPPIECYAGQLNQVFMNLLGNAIDVLEEEGKEHLKMRGKVPKLTNGSPENFTPRICIRTERVGDYAVIRIADNGPGMTMETKQHIFEPFFTTKDPGKGTGLGLSISYQIVVEKHGGQIDCESSPGSGTEFIMTLPIP
ncbi:PAS domain-containing protein [Phormidium pseudopriestleyi FRX01]|uniref:histidine kinase n=1 Tax=Phormidium pseudopriestleyi FRX01 TaxID=1759528 RepID=A0ABS3FMF3_9CYAN|nr:PAS domain-containing protein [Phormidium pseudopriestleyi]MBO0348223.1 PAS domain-containing protein [Phormidium pseudopriestleyi FRX01]